VGKSLYSYEILFLSFCKKSDENWAKIKGNFLQIEAELIFIGAKFFFLGRKFFFVPMKRVVCSDLISLKCDKNYVKSKEKSAKSRLKKLSL